jgi:predicted permease
MALVPVALLLVAASIGQHNDLEWSSAVLQSAAPPMVTAGVVAVAAGLDEDLVSFMVGVGTLVSFLSLPLLSLAL